MGYYLVEDLKISVMYGKASLFIQRGVYYAKNKRTLRHVIGREVWKNHSGIDNNIVPYNVGGTSYLSKNHKITEVSNPVSTEVSKSVLTNKVCIRYSHGIYYIKTTNGWTALPDNEVADYIYKERR
jgi:hypothetical protein